MILGPWRAGRIPGRREYGGLLIVAAMLNGVLRAELLADTGASFTSLSRTTLQALGVDLARPLGRQYVAIADPKGVVEVPMFKLDSMQVGPFKVEGLDVGLLELPHELKIDGLLGVNFLERFRPTFDFANRVLVLREGRAA